MPIDRDAAAVEIARRSRGTPRVANRLLRRVRDYAQVRADGTSPSTWRSEALTLLEVDEHGFDEVDRRLLRTIIEKFSGGPVGVASLAAAMSEERDAIEDIYEPFLIQIGFLDRTPRGRVATRAGLRIFRADRPWKGSAVVNSSRLVARQLRRVKIAGLSTYVPPRRADERRPRDGWSRRRDEWILQRTGISERHIVEPGVATSDLAKEAAHRRDAAGGHHARPDRLHRRRHDDARHDLSEHRVHAAAQDRRAQRVGLRSRRGVLRLHLRADDGHADGGDRRARPRARASAPT